jgi:acetyl esterase/lipase
VCQIAFRIIHPTIVLMTPDITSIPPLPTDESMSYGGDENQFFDVWRPQRGAILGTAVIVHGGFWRASYDLGHASFLCAALAGSGVLTANLEYRRVGQPGGGWPGTFEDVIAGVKAVDEYLGSAPVVIGHSAGGHLALRVAAEPLPLRGVIALAPVADLHRAYELNLSNGAVAEFLGGSPRTVPERYQAACASQRAGSVRRIVVHGGNDKIVPISISRAFVEDRKGDPVPPTLIEIPSAGHFDLIDPESDAWPIVLEVVLQLLRA